MSHELRCKSGVKNIMSAPYLRRLGLERKKLENRKIIKRPNYCIITNYFSEVCTLNDSEQVYILFFLQKVIKVLMYKLSKHFNIVYFQQGHENT
jgi:hypothetical protein